MSTQVERVKKGPRIGRPGADEHIEYYGRYIGLVPGDDVLPALRSQIGETLRLVSGLSDERALHRYAAGKWSVKEVLGHLADAERVFSYRALRFARADATPLAGFDENAYVPAGAFDARPLEGLVEEYRSVRAASIALFGSMDEEAQLRRGQANDAAVSVRALAWICAGHELHHRALLRERYGLTG
jgi:hypothetical protein